MTFASYTNMSPRDAVTNVDTACRCGEQIAMQNEDWRAAMLTADEKVGGFHLHAHYRPYSHDMDLHQHRHPLRT